MNKKLLILLGITTLLLLSLPIYFIFSDNSENMDITLANVEALATPENSDRRDCIAVGTVCTGFNAAGELGTFTGLSIER